MASFYEKLSMKLQGAGQADAVAVPAPSKSVTYNAAGAKTTSAPEPAKPGQTSQAAADAEAEAQPDGTDPLDIDLFQSDSRMVVFAQASGMRLEDLQVTADEESNTLLIQATKKRPDLPLAKGAQSSSEPEKGRYLKQEVKWNTVYRKVYLPAPFDSGGTDAFLQKGVLIVVLPVKKPGEGKKLAVRELDGEEPKK